MEELEKDEKEVEAEKWKAAFSNNPINQDESALAWEDVFKIQK